MKRQDRARHNMHTAPTIRQMVILGLLVFARVVPIHAETYYVSVSGSQIQDGSQRYPYTDLQTAIEGAQQGDTLMVYPGDYNFVDEGLEIDKDLIICNLDPNIVLVTEMTRLYGMVQFDESVTEACVLNGFTFMGMGEDKGGLRGYHSNPTIKNCIFQGNGPCSSLIKACDGLFQNCLIVDNQQFQDCGSPEALIDDCNAMFINCTIANNRNGIQLNGGFIENCIITGSGGAQILKRYSSQEDIVVQYSNVSGWSELVDNEVITLGLDGNDMLDVDPNFVKEGYWDTNEPIVFYPGDYHLKSKGWRWMKLGDWTQDDWTSYCVDAGNPDPNWLGNEYYSELRIPNEFYDANALKEGWNPAVNLGFYGGTYEASVLQAEETPWTSNWGSGGQGGTAVLTPATARWKVKPKETTTMVGWQEVSSCTMTATQVISSTGNQVFYMFDCKTVDIYDRDWEINPKYEFKIDQEGDAKGLQFRVKAKDEITLDETEWSGWATVQ